jgi:hypothetical protein
MKRKTTKKLSLHTESIRTLSNTLTQVVGGSQDGTSVGCGSDTGQIPGTTTHWYTWLDPGH